MTCDGQSRIILAASQGKGREGPTRSECPHPKSLAAVRYRKRIWKSSIANLQSLYQSIRRQSGAAGSTGANSLLLSCACRVRMHDEGTWRSMNH